MSQYLKQQNNMVVNNAGGLTFQITPWQRLERFLILGSENGSYYVAEKKLTAQNTQNLITCIKADGPRVVKTVTEISVAGRAPKNDPALFALAACTVYGDVKTKQTAYNNMASVARTGTHLLHFLAYQESLGAKWNRSRRTAIANWYNNKTPGQLAYQLAKYRQRDGWSHKDVLVLTHPKPASALHDALYNYAVHGWSSVGTEPHPQKELQLLWALERAQNVDWKTGINLITDYHLTHEMLPTEWKKQREIWEALLPKMLPEATMRNLGVMSSFDSFWNAQNYDLLLSKFTAANIREARLHPINVLTALRVYTTGRGFRGNNTWYPNRSISAMLDSSFYQAFANCEPTGKNTLFAVDVSGSMSSPIGLGPLTSAEAAAALAMQGIRTEQNAIVCGFANDFRQLPITPDMRLERVLEITRISNFGGTDATIPLRWARNHKIPVECFAIITDCETWMNKTTVHRELQNYRDAMGIPAKEAVLGTEATEFSIADPNDAGQLDLVGFDTTTPSVMFDFFRS